jgi:hypothetical protein
VKTRARASGSLIAIDGVNGRAVMRTAVKLASEARRDRAGVSSWDASGIFGELEAADPDVERPSARTLMLLYAADLAFRIRWEIAPALAEGRTVIAAPYVDTALAFGRAMGINEPWLRTIFEFAPPAKERRYVEGATLPNAAGPGFVECACRMLAGMEARAVRRDLVTRVQIRLKGSRSRK